MMNLSEAGRSRLRGSGHLILNVFRAFNIVGLAAVATSSWVMIVMSGIKGSFFFFEAASHFFNSVIAGFLIVSELNLFKRYFATRWPVLSPYHGLTWLGVAMVVMGCHVLGNLNRRSVTADELGGHFYRLILASGILAITFGAFNIISSFIFGDSANGITARNVRSDGAIASAAPYKSGSGYAESFSTHSEPSRNEKTFRRLTQKFPWANKDAKKTTSPGHTRQISKPFNFSHQDRDADTADVEFAAAAAASSRISDDKTRDDYAPSTYPDSEDRRSPIMPDIPRPPTALHPAYSRHTHYSEASHMNRF
ncbi:hypothetical protein B0T11DRAFT_48274 [Plectosphaerella cucumerina]|uniref:DUF7598 domain-containing protein n=1 Tax=Plectosphaerella cucumerina TaxID=40658 RepID=A0A8K0X4J3_9PEZI|nr:hypothetical protein B0T11DRAFT_48274 [Plectosphaerella cucumerina]